MSIDLNWGQIIIALIAGAGAAFSSLLVFRKGKGDNKTANDARIDAKQREELERLYKRMEAMEKQLADYAVRFREQDKKITELEDRHRADSNAVSDMAEVQEEMVEHIERLESLIPNPPGVPERPDWMKNINGLGLA